MSYGVDPKAAADYVNQLRRQLREMEERAKEAEFERDKARAVGGQLCSATENLIIYLRDYAFGEDDEHGAIAGAAALAERWRSIR